MLCFVGVRRSKSAWCVRLVSTEVGVGVEVGVRD